MMEVWDKVGLPKRKSKEAGISPRQAQTQTKQHNAMNSKHNTISDNSEN